MLRRLPTVLVATGCCGALLGCSAALATMRGVQRASGAPSQASTPVTAAAAADPEPAAAAAPLAGLPTLGVSWQGMFDTNVAPPDPNGAIGPKSYVEIINDQLGIYNRSAD